MATYDELLIAKGTPALINKVRVAIIISAETIRTELSSVTNHTARAAWAKDAYNTPDSKLEGMMWAVLAQNKSATLAQITGATDATVQTAVDAAVNAFI